MNPDKKATSKEALNLNFPIIEKNDSGWDSAILKAKKELEAKIKDLWPGEKSDFLTSQIKDLKDLNSQYDKFKKNKFDSKTNKKLSSLFNEVINEIKINSSINDELNEIKWLVNWELKEKNKIETELNWKYKKYFESSKNWWYIITIEWNKLPIELYSKEEIHKAIEYILSVLKKLENYPKSEKLYLSRDKISETLWLTGNTEAELSRKPDLHLWDISVDQKYQPEFMDDRVVTKEEFKKVFWSGIVYDDLTVLKNFLEKVR